MRVILFCAVLLCSSVVFGQGQYGPQMLSPPPQQFQQQTPMPTAPPLVPPMGEAWQNGWKETFQYTHEYRPLNREYERQGGYNPQQYPVEQGWYWNQQTGNYQRNCQPTYQQPVYQQPTQYCYPQQPTQYGQPQQYYYPQRSYWSLW